MVGEAVSGVTVEKVHHQFYCLITVAVRREIRCQLHNVGRITRHGVELPNDQVLS